MLAGACRAAYSIAALLVPGVTKGLPKSFTDIMSVMGLFKWFTWAGLVGCTLIGLKLSIESRMPILTPELLEGLYEVADTGRPN